MLEITVLGIGRVSPAAWGLSWDSPSGSTAEWFPLRWEAEIWMHAGWQPLLARYRGSVLRPDLPTSSDERVRGYKCWTEGLEIEQSHVDTATGHRGQVDALTTTAVSVDELLLHGVEATG